MDLGVLLESPQGSQSSSRGEACTCAFLPSCSSSVTLPFAWIKGSVAFPRGFPTGLSHRDVPRATVVRVDPRLERPGSAGKKGFPGMDRDIWWTLGMVARPWSSSRLSCGERLLLRCDRKAGILSRPRRERIPPLELGGGNGAPLDVGRTLVLPLEWRLVCRGTS